MGHHGGVSRNEKPVRRWVTRVGIVALVVVLVLASGVTGAYWWLSARIDRFDVALPDGDPGGVWLIVGLDDREVADDAGVSEDVGGAGPGARADIVLMAMPQEDGLHVLSVDRGLLIYDDRGFERIGNSWLDGPQRTVDLMCEGLDIKVEHVVAVNFLTIVDVVDALGGLEVDLPYALRDEPAHLSLPAGTQYVDGRTALALVRSREASIEVDGVWQPEPEGAAGRQSRAGMVLSAMLDSAAEAGAARLMGAVVAGADSVAMDSGTSLVDLYSLWPTQLEFDQLAVEHLATADYLAELTPAGEEQLVSWQHPQCHPR